MVRAVAAIFHGQEDEAQRLLAAIERNCTCTREPSGARTGLPCAPHAALLDDQRFVDGVLCMRRLRARLEREEWREPEMREEG